MRVGRYAGSGVSSWRSEGDLRGSRPSKLVLVRFLLLIFADRGEQHRVGVHRNDGAGGGSRPPDVPACWGQVEPRLSDPIHPTSSASPSSSSASSFFLIIFLLYSVLPPSPRRRAAENSPSLICYIPHTKRTNSILTVLSASSPPVEASSVASVARTAFRNHRVYTSTGITS